MEDEGEQTRSLVIGGKPKDLNLLRHLSPWVVYLQASYYVIVCVMMIK